MESYKEKFREIRRTFKLTQDELAKVLDVKSGNISYYNKNEKAIPRLPLQDSTDNLYALIKEDIDAAKKFVEDKLSS